MKKLFYKLAGWMRLVYYFFVRPKTRGVKCLIEHDGKFLLIRNTYGKKHWTMPGGGFKTGESPEEATRREVREEVGITLGKVEFLGTYYNTRRYKRDTVYCFYAQVTDSQFTIDPGEILEAKWFSKEEIPEFRSPAVAELLKLAR